MSKMFYNVKPEHVEGLSYWFWQREGFAMMFELLPAAIKDFFNDPAALRDPKSWGQILLYVPLGIIVIVLVGGRIGQGYAKKCVKNGSAMEIFGKTGIEYFTILEMLGGNKQEDDEYDF